MRYLRKPRRYRSLESVVEALHKADPDLPIESVYMLLQALDLPTSEWSMAVYNDQDLGEHLETEAGYGIGEEQLTLYGLGGVISIAWRGVVTHTIQHSANFSETKSDVHPRADARKASLKAELIAVCRKYGVTLNEGGNVLSFTSMDVEADYTQEQLEAAFKLVQPPGNWKNPIQARVLLDDAGVELTRQAIVHFTGGGAIDFVPANRPTVNGKTLYTVTAPGYYVVIGA